MNSQGNLLGRLAGARREALGAGEKDWAQQELRPTGGDEDLQKRDRKRAIFQRLAADFFENKEVENENDLVNASNWFFAGYQDFSHFFTHFSPFFSVASNWF